MKLLLTSNGFIGTPVEQDFLELVDNRENLNVAIIPTASDKIEWVPEKEGSDKYVAKLIKDADKRDGKAFSYFKEKGYDVDIVDLKGDKSDIKQRLENVDVIYVTGGDPNYLVDWARRAELGKYLKDLLYKGVVYVGQSAGSQMVLPDFGLTWWNPDKWQEEDRFGLSVVDFVLIPHQSDGDPEKTEEALIKKKKYLQSIINFPWKVYLVQDGQAIKVDGERVEHIGPGEKKAI